MFNFFKIKDILGGNPQCLDFHLSYTSLDKAERKIIKSIAVETLRCLRNMDVNLREISSLHYKEGKGFSMFLVPDAKGEHIKLKISKNEIASVFFYLFLSKYRDDNKVIELFDKVQKVAQENHMKNKEKLLLFKNKNLKKEVE